MKKKAKPEPSVAYTYAEPETDEERIIQESNVSKAYDILFSETLRRLREKDPGGNLSTF